MSLQPFMLPGIVEAGCDEAGRGCLCGPVACAAVILPPDFCLPGLDDSKRLSEAKRRALRPLIEQQALAWAVVMVSPRRIDELNILQASITGMHEAVEELCKRSGLKPQHILVDGNRFRPYKDVPHTTVVGGDGKYASIAAASVLAKTHRDELMAELAAGYPGYGWDRNMGYPTRDHREAIAALGLTPHHRRSFGPCKKTADNHHEQS